MKMGFRPTYTPSIQELRALTLVAELGSASEAAEALNLTQSAVSRAIRSLEARLGVRLFRRERQRLHLSDAGRAMVRDAREILARLDASAQMVMAFGGADEVLRLAVLPTFATAWLIPRLAAFAAAHPAISLDLTDMLGPVDFDSQPFDASLQRAEMAPPGARVAPLFDERLIVVAAPHLVGTAPLRPEDCARFPLIQQATRPELWRSWFAEAGADPLQHLRGPRFAHFGMVLAAAQAGLGLALIPDLFAARALAEGSLRQAGPQALTGRSSYALIQPQRAPSSPAVAAFASWVQAQLQAPG